MVRSWSRTTCADEAPKHRDHPLAEEWRGFRDCHVRPDWVLIYRIEGNELQLARTGSHADLFG
jgi:mRNA interferase YafQ